MTILRSGSATDVGHVRSVNEDLALQTSTLFAVADGMGGHAGGEVAARTAIDSLRMGFEHAHSADGLVKAVREANQAVWQKSQSDPSLRGMGTTLTAAALVGTADGDRMVLANVGDSRGYRLHGEELDQLTVDHSVAEELVARGELSESEAAVHPHRHILTCALGIDADVEVDSWELVPEEGDRFLLCSDGLSNEIPAEEIERVLSQARDPQEAADQLVRIANEHGGNDNITAVVLDVLIGAPTSDDGHVEQRAGSAGVEAGAAGGSAVADQVLDEKPPPTVHRPTTTEAPPPRRPVSRRITFRVLLFVVVLGGVVYGAWAGTRWYVDSSYFVGLRHGQVVLFQGRRGGFLWFDPKVLETTGITLSEVQSSGIGSAEIAPTLESGIEEPSRSEAVHYVCNLPVLAPGSPQPRWVPNNGWAKCASTVQPSAPPPGSPNGPESPAATAGPHAPVSPTATAGPRAAGSPTAAAGPHTAGASAVGPHTESREAA